MPCFNQFQDGSFVAQVEGGETFGCGGLDITGPGHYSCSDGGFNVISISTSEIVLDVPATYSATGTFGCCGIVLTLSSGTNDAADYFNMTGWPFPVHIQINLSHTQTASALGTITLTQDMVGLTWRAMPNQDGITEVQYNYTPPNTGGQVVIYGPGPTILEILNFPDPGNTCNGPVTYYNDGTETFWATIGGGSGPMFNSPPYTPSVGSPGNTVIISGTGFTGTTAVNFNGTSSSFTILSDTTIIATVPNGATSGPITVTNGGGSMNTPQNFFVIPSLIGPAIFHYS
jgi:hypothetical protein